MTFPREGYTPQGWESKNHKQEKGDYSEQDSKISKPTTQVDTKLLNISQKYDLLQKRMFKHKYNYSGYSSLLLVIFLVLLLVGLQVVDNVHEINRLNRKSKGTVDTAVWLKINENNKFSAYVKRDSLDDEKIAKKLSGSLMTAMDDVEKSARAFEGEFSIGNERYSPMCAAIYQGGLDWDCMVSGGDEAYTYFIDLKEK